MKIHPAPALLLLIATAAHGETSCEGLAKLALPDTTITLAQTVAAGEFAPPAGGGPGGAAAFKTLPAFCRVAATLKPSSDSDIKIEVWLPATGWNGKFEAVGNGGWSGAIGYGPLGRMMARGYAAASTDTGHAGGSGSFALGHPEKLIDFGYRAVHEMTVKGKAITAAFYGSGPKLSYWNGCSSGGKQGLKEAQRYPADYDGIIAGAPANYWTHLVTWSLWVGQASFKDPAVNLKDKFKLLHNAALEMCDARDGVKDGVIEDPASCRFDPKVLECKGDDTSNCLTAPQIEAARKAYSGAINPRTKLEIFPGLEPGSEMGWGPLAAGPQPFSIATDHYKYVVFKDANWDWLTLNFDSDVALADKTDSGLLNATVPNRRDFFGGEEKTRQYPGGNEHSMGPPNGTTYSKAFPGKTGENNPLSLWRGWSIGREAMDPATPTGRTPSSSGWNKAKRPTRLSPRTPPTARRTARVRSARIRRWPSTREQEARMMPQISFVKRLREISLLLFIFLAACGKSAPEKPEPPPAVPVDGTRIIAADRTPGEWLSHGRTYSEQRFSPLSQITTQNVAQLKPAWHFDLDTDRGQESTPIVANGLVYITSAWSNVYAFEAGTGKLVWSFDPHVPKDWSVHACCDAVNRGVAIWRNKVFVGTLHGWLIALDANTGVPVWRTLTIDRNLRYAITGAPRVVKGRVLIGNAGAENGVRGYISAYDAETGKQVWRVYTVPGDPAKPFESPALEKAAKTWKGQWWKLGGGGTVWDNMSYDPQLDLLYFGTGNGSPWNAQLRSPQGGDNLYLSSIIAVKPDNGEYVWHYQENPGDAWDYDAVQQIVLANLTIDGKPRKVLMHAPKNGFFYVLDRATGELISAKAFTQVTWAREIDLKPGRPVENPASRYAATGKPWLAVPGPLGGHNWQPMSFNPINRLAYLPVVELPFTFIAEKKFEPKMLAWNLGIDTNTTSLPQDDAVKKQIKALLKGHLAAWDPVAQREVWRAENPSPWNGGVLSTGGSLVFQGDSDGKLNAYNAATGAKLWSGDVQTGILAAPISYEWAGEQYIAIETGYGGAFGLTMGELARDLHVSTNRPRVVAYKLNGADALPPVVAPAKPSPQMPADTASAAVVAQGKAHFSRFCWNCHGDAAVSGGLVPDLRFSAALSDKDLWKKTVGGGALKQLGMPGFGSELNADDLEALRAYVIHRANEQAALEKKKP